MTIKTATSQVSTIEASSDCGDYSIRIHIIDGKIEEIILGNVNGNYNNLPNPRYLIGLRNMLDEVLAYLAEKDLLGEGCAALSVQSVNQKTKMTDKGIMRVRFQLDPSLNDDFDSIGVGFPDADDFGNHEG